MKIYLKQANILDIEADALICSANVCLNLTGGVGADIVSRYGTEMQADLHSILSAKQEKFARPGEVYSVYTKGLPYKVILHAVAVDPMYISSVEIITEVVTKALKICQQHSAKNITLTALASGFGNLELEDFAQGIKNIKEEFVGIETITIPQIEDYRFKELIQAFPDATIIE